MDPEALLKVCVVAAVVTLLPFGFALRAWRRLHLIRNIPTSKVAGVFIGLVELKGTAETETPLTGYLSGTRSVWNRWWIEEEWERWETRTSTDSNGRKTTTRHRRSGWTTVAKGGGSNPFYLRDETGVLLVHPNQMEIKSNRVFREHAGRGHPLYYGKGPASGIMNSTGRRRFTEEAIPLHSPLYVMARARERRDVVAAEIAYDPEARLNLLSTKPQESLERGYHWQVWLLLILPVVLVTVGLVHLEADLGDGLIIGRILPGYLAGVGLVLFLGWLWVEYNHLVDLRQRVKRAWSRIDVELKRRSTLIPQLVSVVEGYRKHEETVQRQVAELRTQAAATEPGEPGPNPAACLPRLIALREDYPELKSDELFRKLQEELTTTEQRIALARGYFNDICTNYNIKLGVFPQNLLARLTRFVEHPLLEAEGFVRAPVSVNLAD